MVISPEWLLLQTCFQLAILYFSTFPRHGAMRMMKVDVYLSRIIEMNIMEGKQERICSYSHKIQLF